MESKILYHCTGSCGGVSSEPKSCGAESCDMHGHPLKAYKQCEGCTSAMEKDGQNHICDQCTPI